MALSFQWYRCDPDGTNPVAITGETAQTYLVAIADNGKTIRVDASDGVTTVRSTQTIVVTTPDTSAPTVPTGLSATAISATRVDLSWTASTDDTAVTGYDVYRDGTLIGTSAGLTYSDTGCSPSTTYSYTVAAYDAAGNTSAQSSSASATTPAGSITYLFQDEFTGATLDSAKWVNLDHIAYGGMSTAKAANAFLNGSGQLVLRAKRETSAWDGRNFSGGAIGSYQYQTGWPPSPIKASWPVPFAYEVRFKLPNVDAAWCGPGWNQNVDHTTAQGLWELDVGETRTTYPTRFGANQHHWVNGVDTDSQGAYGIGTDGRSNYHVMRMEARTTSVKYYLDDVLVASHDGVTGTFGVQLHNQIADSGSWGSGGLQPDVSDPGPWDMLIDYVRVWAL